jgi:hypothetical protein
VRYLPLRPFGNRLLRRFAESYAALSMDIPGAFLRVAVLPRLCNQH